MIVKDLLLGRRGNVVTIEPTSDLAAAVNVLAERRIGAVVILGADHRIVGILSERDIVHALAEHGPTALHRTVSQFMTRDVKTCSENDTIESLMGSYDHGKIPPSAGGGARKARRHCANWRCGQEPRRRDRARSRGLRDYIQQ